MTPLRRIPSVRATALCFALGGCGDAGMIVAADASSADAAIDAAVEDTGGFVIDLPEASIDPVDAPAPVDVSVAKDVAPASDGGAVELDVSVSTDTPPTTDAPPTPDTPAMPDSGTCPIGATMCEGMCLPHATSPNACNTAVTLGEWCGDSNCNSPLCRATTRRNVAMRIGRSTQWFRARAVECSICSGSINARITLEVPPGVDYDLFVHRPCGTVSAQSIRNAGETDSVELTQPDRGGPEDTFDYFIEVRYVSGGSCNAWTLTIEARGPNASDC